MNPLQTGTLTTWNDARGFGFVRPDDGSDDVFLHIKALPPQCPRPEVGQRVRYQLVLSADRKPRAAGARLLSAQAGQANAQAAGTPRASAKPAARPNGATGQPRTNAATPQQQRQGQGSRASAPGTNSASGRSAVRTQRATRGTEFGAASYFFIPAFALLFAACSVVWPVPLWLAGVYLVLSLITFAVYAADKRAAQTGAWRVSEKNLLLLGLVGGWPGAIVAQQQLRHKSAKAEFRAAFWATVWLNAAGFVVLFSPWGQRWLGLA